MRAKPALRRRGGVADRIRTRVDALRARLGPLGWGALVVFGISRCGDVANLVAKFFLGRTLSDVDFGALEPVFSALVLLGLPVAVVYQVAVKSISRLRARDEHAECRALLADLVKLAAVGSAVSIAVVVVLRSFILSRLHLRAGAYVPIIAALFLLNWWQPLALAIVQGARRYSVMLLTTVVLPLLMLVLTVVFVGVAGWGLPGALAARVTAGAVVAGLVFGALRKLFRGERRSYSKEFWFMRTMLLPMAVFLTSSALVGHFDRLFVRNFLLEDSGGYAAILTLGQIPAYFVAPIVFVVFPLAAAEHASGRDLRRFFRQAVLIGVGATAICVCGFTLTGEWLLRTWSPAFAPYAGYLGLYALTVGMSSITRVVASVEMARHRYGFLWFVTLPAIAMCLFLYARRDVVTLGGVVLTVTLTRAVILVCVLAHGFLTQEGRK